MKTGVSNDIGSMPTFGAHIINVRHMHPSNPCTLIKRPSVPIGKHRCYDPTKIMIPFRHVASV